MPQIYLNDLKPMIEQPYYNNIATDIIAKSEIDEAVGKIERNLKKHRRNLNRNRWRNTRFKRKH